MPRRDPPCLGVDEDSSVTTGCQGDFDLGIVGLSGPCETDETFTPPEKRTTNLQGREVTNRVYAVRLSFSM